jgi:hypothetical protein
MTVFIAKVTKTYVRFVWETGILKFVLHHNPTCMKRVLAVIALLGFLASCSQYTCPTYSKKEIKKTDNKI